VRFYEFYADDWYYYIVTEYCAGGDLFTLLSEIGDISEKEASTVMRQILTALEYCHKRNIVHRYCC
jgi:calcium-dependent protein kinase